MFPVCKGACETGLRSSLEARRSDGNRCASLVSSERQRSGQTLVAVRTRVSVETAGRKLNLAGGLPVPVVVVVACQQMAEHHLGDIDLGAVSKYSWFPLFSPLQLLPLALVPGLSFSHLFPCLEARTLCSLWITTGRPWPLFRTEMDPALVSMSTYSYICKGI